jgi:hypothetical protein
MEHRSEKNKEEEGTGAIKVSLCLICDHMGHPHGTDSGQQSIGYNKNLIFMK